MHVHRYVYKKVHANKAAPGITTVKNGSMAIPHTASKKKAGLATNRQSFNGASTNSWSFAPLWCAPWALRWSNFGSSIRLPRCMIQRCVPYSSSATSGVHITNHRMNASSQPRGVMSSKPMTSNDTMLPLEFSAFGAHSEHRRSEEHTSEL